MIYLFDNNKQLLNRNSILYEDSIITFSHTKDLNSIYDMSFEVPVMSEDNENLYDRVSRATFVGFKETASRFQMYKITSIDTTNDTFIVSGVHLFIDENKSNKVIRDRRFRMAPLREPLEAAFEGTGWQVVEIDENIADFRSLYLDYVSPLDAKNEIVKAYGAEFDYWIEFNGSQITGRKISVKRKIGRITSKIYDYGSNILSISAEQDMTELYSAIMPYGSEVEREDGSKRPLTIKDVSWSTTGNISYPVNKPLGDEILELKNVTDLIGYVDSNGNTKPRIAIMNFDTDNAMTLMNLAYSWIVENSLPKIVFNLEVFDGDNLQLGDEVMIAYNNIGLVKPTRAVRITKYPITGQVDVEFGDIDFFEGNQNLKDLEEKVDSISNQNSGDLGNDIGDSIGDAVSDWFENNEFPVEFDEIWVNKIHSLRNDNVYWDLNAGIFKGTQLLWEFSNGAQMIKKDSGYVAGMLISQDGSNTPSVAIGGANDNGEDPAQLTPMDASYSGLQIIPDREMVGVNSKIIHFTDHSRGYNGNDYTQDNKGLVLITDSNRDPDFSVRDGLLEFRPRTNLANQEFNLGSEAFPFTRLYVKELIGPDGNNILIPSEPGEGEPGEGEPPEIPELTSFEFSDNDSTATGDANGFTYSGQQRTIRLGELEGNAGLRVEGGSSFAQMTTSGIGLQGASGISMHSGGTGVDISQASGGIHLNNGTYRYDLMRALDVLHDLVIALRSSDLELDMNLTPAMTLYRQQGHPLQPLN